MATCACSRASYLTGSLTPQTCAPSQVADVQAISRTKETGGDTYEESEDIDTGSCLGNRARRGICHPDHEQSRIECAVHASAAGDGCYVELSQDHLED